MSAKSEILQRIADAGSMSHAAARQPSAVDYQVARHAVVEQFAEYAREYRANVVRAGAGFAESIALVLRNKRVVVPLDLPSEWVHDGVDTVEDSAIDHRSLATIPSVLTGCAIAIAETGTVVLDGGFAQGRRAITLIPDHHVCIVFEDQVVWSVNEAVAALEPAIEAGRPLTWISGPSATSDIELSRVEGVHGPRTLDIILVAR